MTRLIPSPPGDPRRPHGPRDPGDAWIEGDRGKFWGRYGAAGVLIHDEERGILLQHRADWSDQGGTWGLPGGALHEGEDAVTGALREAREEAAVPSDRIRVLFTFVFDAGYWSYTTVAATVTQPFEPVISDPESIDLRWVPVDQVAGKPLHSGFSAAWPRLRAALPRTRFIVVDAANVVGSRPDGWWRDRRKAARHLIDALSALAQRGMPVSIAVHPESNDSDSNVSGSNDSVPNGRYVRIWPRIIVVTEGQANGARGEPADVQVVPAPRDGDQTIVDTVRRLRMSDSDVQVVTADRELRDRVEALGARVTGPGWLLARLDAAG